MLSILISTYNRVKLFRRTLWAVANRPPSAPFEVIVADEMSTEDVLSELKAYSSVFSWTFIRVDPEEFTKKTGLKKFHNNPSLTNNIAFRHIHDDSTHVFLQGNEVIPYGNVYNAIIRDYPDTDFGLVMSTTYDIPQISMLRLDEYGSNLDENIFRSCLPYFLQSEHYRSDVTNYISMCSRELWERIGGYNEQYFGGISREDSDFCRRARILPGFKQVISTGVSLHQFHGGKTLRYEPDPSVISQERFYEGCKINTRIFDAWDNTPENPQTWPWGTYGVVEVIKNV
jgi:glycosyltransferase involved in cell wall biosynthesis